MPQCTMNCSVEGRSRGEGHPRVIIFLSDVTSIEDVEKMCLQKQICEKAEGKQTQPADLAAFHRQATL